MGSSPTASDMAKLRWKGTTKAQRSEELRRIAKLGWASGKRPRKGAK